jgi:hypothetical protein
MTALKEVGLATQFHQPDFFYDAFYGAFCLGTMKLKLGANGPDDVALGGEQDSAQQPRQIFPIIRSTAASSGSGLSEMLGS